LCVSDRVMLRSSRIHCQDFRHLASLKPLEDGYDPRGRVSALHLAPRGDLFPAPARLLVAPTRITVARARRSSYSASRIAPLL